jgi:hypothetical protein
MKGDFSRDSFDPQKNFTRVLWQQGRVLYDADLNEQVSIFWHHWRAFIKHFIGPYGGPEDNCGFKIVTAKTAENDLKSLPDQEKNALRQLLKNQGEFLIGPGDFYVDGIFCSNPRFVPFSSQQAGTQSALKEDGDYLIYLDVWERYITDLEDASIREVALNGLDTCTRAKLVWCVRSCEWSKDMQENYPDAKRMLNSWTDIAENLFKGQNRGLLQVRLGRVTDSQAADSTVSGPKAGYPGLQNQLYRVEIHGGGAAEKATFKWSRKNGLVVFPIVSMADPVVTLSHLRKDFRSELQVGDWIEIVDDDYEMQNRAESLRQVEKIDSAKRQVTLNAPKAKPTSTVGHDSNKHPLMRRWDQKHGDNKRGGFELTGEGAVSVKEEDWFTLENGLQIQFLKPNDSKQTNTYRTGDYWFFPTRITGVEWPTETDSADTVEPMAIPPHGVDHHYAPLAIVEFEDGNLKSPSDMRAKFEWWAG